MAVASSSEISPASAFARSILTFPSWGLVEAVAVGQNPEALAAVRSPGVVRSQHNPLRIEPD
jgi:hypothetical protein